MLGITIAEMEEGPKLVGSGRVTLYVPDEINVRTLLCGKGVVTETSYDL